MPLLLLGQGKYKKKKLFLSNLRLTNEVQYQRVGEKKT
jgi:hypothetical protein